MSKIVRINDGDYKLSVRDSSGNLTLTTFEASSSSTSKINLFSKEIVMDGINGSSTILSTDNTSLTLFNTAATTVNAFGAATAINFGASTGILTIKNAYTVLYGDLEVKGGDITTNQSTFNLLNTVATTINSFGTATTINIGPTITHIVDTITQTGPILQLVKNGADSATVTVQGDLVVYGTRTEVNAGTLTVDDVNIELGKIATPTNITANGGGITLKGTTDKTITWANDSNFNWTSSENWNLATGKIYKINNVTVVTPTTLLPTATTIEIGTAGGSVTVHNDTLILDGDLLVKGGDITTNQTTFNLLNTTATTVNAFGAATTVKFGANGTGSKLTISNETTDVNNILMHGTSLEAAVTSFNLLNTPTTITAFNSASTLGLGASTGTLTIHNPSTILNGDLTLNGGSDNICTISTIATTPSVELFRQYATTVNAFDAATTINFGATSGTFTIHNASVVLDGDLQVNGGDLTTSQATFNLLNTTATTVNAFGAATTIGIGATTGTLTLHNASVVLDGDLLVKGGDITTNQTTFNLLNTTATTVNAFGVASSINIGSTSGILTVNNADVVLKGNLEVDGDMIIKGGSDGILNISAGSSTTGLNLFTQYVSTVSAFGAATSITFNQLSLINGNLKLSGTGSLNVASGTVISDSTSVNLFTSTATTINLGSDNTGTTNLNSTYTNLKSATINNLNVVSSAYIQPNQILLNKITTPTDATANAGGIVLKGTTDKTITWTSTNSSWNFSENVNLVSGKEYRINSVGVLTASSILPNAATVSVAGASTTLNLGGASTTTLNVGDTSTIVNITGELHVNKILVDSQFVSDYAQYTVSGLPTEAVVTSFSAAVYRSAKYFIQIISTDGVHACEISVLQRNGQTTMVQYLDHYLGTVVDDSNGTFDVRYNSGTDSVELVLTPLKSNVQLHIAMTLVKI